MTDMAGIIRIAQRLTCVISYDKVQTLCYHFYLLQKLVIRWNKIIIKKNHLASYHFAVVNYHFAGEKWEKHVLRRHFLPVEITIFSDANWEKLILRRYFLTEVKKSELEGLNYKKSYFQLDMTLFPPNAASIFSPCSDGKLHMFGKSWNLNKKAFLRSCRNISKEIIHWPSPCQLSFKRG